MYQYFAKVKSKSEVTNVMSSWMVVLFIYLL